MSFVMIATGAASRSRVRTLSIRHVLAAAAAAALMLLAAGAGLGYWLAAPAGSVAPAAQERPRPMLPFTLEQIGALSGRLFKLESQAAQLSRRLGVQPAAAPQDTGASAAVSGAGSGGPMLPPRPATASQQLLQDLSAIERHLARLEQQIALVADAATMHSLALMRLPSRRPVTDANVVSGFGNRSDPFNGRHAFHAGLDFAAEYGSPILAAAGGTVSFAGYRPDYGWTVEIDHGNGLTTRYAHASRLAVKSGAVVAPGERVAAVGSSGRSTGPHLHFEVLRNGEQIDPRRYLAGM
ncbi:MAG: peptidoglycan DD-metalloendopeptidase family protein [Pseudomonadota bacterium]